jgi:hypothetical protein
MRGMPAFSPLPLREGWGEGAPMRAAWPISACSKPLSLK